MHLQSNLTNCRVPGCGGWAKVADGLFEFTQTGTTVISAPDVTYDMLVALRVVLRQAYEQDLPVEEIRRRAEDVNPAFGGLFDPVHWSGQVKVALIAAVGAMVTAYITTREAPVNVNVSFQHVQPEVILEATQNIPAASILRGEADRHIATEIARIIARPKLKPDQTTQPGSPPGKDRPQ